MVMTVVETAVDKAPIIDGRAPGGREVGRSTVLDLSTLNKWRAVFYDRIEGLVVVDVNADNEADARGVAFRAATEVLKLTQIQSPPIVKCHSDMPESWLRYKTRSLQHVKPMKGKRR